MDLQQTDAPSFDAGGDFRIPPMPAAALKLIELCNDERSATDDLARIIETDPALSSRMLHLVNSAAYGLRQPVGSVKRALIIQGFEQTRAQAIQLLVFDRLVQKGAGQTAFDRLAYWQHSLFVGFLSRLLGEQLEHRDPESLYIAGLLHDIGKLILDSSEFLSYGEFLAMDHQRGQGMLEAEQGFFGTRHDQLAAWCSRQWGLPQIIVRAQEQHHGLAADADQTPAQVAEVAIVRFADFIAWMHGLGSVTAPAPPALDPQIHRLVFPRQIRLRSNLLDSLIALSQQGKGIGRRPSAQPLSLTAPHRNLDPGRFIPATLDAIRRDLQVARAMLWRVLPERRGLGRFPQTDGDPDDGGAQQIPVSLLNQRLLQALRQRRALRLQQPDDRPLLRHIGCAQALVAPVLRAGRLYGLVWLDNLQQLLPGGDDLLEDLAAITRELGIALSNSHAFNRQRRQAQIDGLTGLLNRSALDQQLQQAFQRQRSGGPGLTLGLVDVDKFKQFNDLFGHARGDDVLRVVAQALANLSRPGDILGRYGGDEFLFALIGSDRQGALAFAERARREVARRGLLLAKRFQGRGPTVSIGLAQGEPGLQSLQQQLGAADQALYEVKRGGRDGVGLYRPEDWGSDGQG
jgi:two-component system cell cycle response regulator